VTSIEFERVIIYKSGFRAFSKSFSTARYIYLLKRDIFGAVILFLNFTFFFIILIALDGSILEFFSLTNFTRAIAMPALAFSGLRYILKSSSYSSLLELLKTCISFIPIRIMRKLIFILFLA
jgi:hypothetical protein